MREYQAQNGATQLMPSLNEIAGMYAGGAGFCLACGETQPTEPDARKDKCECCGAPKVFGAEELVMMNLFYTE